MSTTYTAIDFTKFILSFLVIIIHSNAYQLVSEDICALAVPVFFVFSGFFLYKSYVSSNKNINKLKSYLYKVIKLYLVYTSIYIPLTIYGFVKNDISPLRAIFIFVRQFLFVGENFFSWPLWYLLALIVSVFIIICFLKYNVRIFTIFIISFLFTVTGILINYLDNAESLPAAIDRFLYAYKKIFITTRNGLFVGLGYVSTGMLIARYEAYIRKWNKIVCILFCVAIAYYYYGLPLGLNVMASITVCVLIQPQMNNWIVNKEHSIWLRNMSTLNYFFHMYFLFVVQTFIAEYLNGDIYMYIPKEILMFIITTVLTLIFSATVLTLLRNEKYRFLRILIS